MLWPAGAGGDIDVDCDGDIVLGVAYEPFPTDATAVVCGSDLLFI